MLKQPDTRGHTLYGLIFVECPELVNPYIYVEIVGLCRMQINDCQGLWGREERVTYWDNNKIFWNLDSVMVRQHCDCIKDSLMKRIACLLLVIFLLYSWYFINLWETSYIWWILTLFLYASNILSKESVDFSICLCYFLKSQKLKIFTWYDLLIFSLYFNLKLKIFSTSRILKCFQHFS